MIEPRIVTRAEWGAPANTARVVGGPWFEVVIHTEAGAVLPGDWDALTELATVLSLTERQHAQAIDRYHRESRGWDDGIGYSFLIERDGTIIEGRGWDRQGVHTQGRNSSAAGLCFAGHGDLQSATEAQWLAAAWLIGEGIRLGHLTPSPRITGHRDYAAKSCPGDLVYPHLHRLRGITGPSTHGGLTMATLSDSQAQQLVDDARTAANRAERSRAGVARLEAEMRELRQQVQTLTETQHRATGSHRGWLAAIAEKLGVPRDRAVALDTSRPRE